MPDIGEIKRGTEVGFKHRGEFVWVACERCGRERWVRLEQGQARSHLCNKCKNGKRETSNNWKGGRYKNPNGYIYILLEPDEFFYPMANHRGYVMEHRLVAAKALGRCLQPWELVHHKEGYAKDDNRYPETLQLVQEMQHNQITVMENKIKALERRITLLEAENVRLSATVNWGV